MVPAIADAETRQIGEDEERKRPRDPAEQDLLKVLEALHATRPHNGRVFLSKYGVI